MAKNYIVIDPKGHSSRYVYYGPDLEKIGQARNTDPVRRISRRTAAVTRQTLRAEPFPALVIKRAISLESVKTRPRKRTLAALEEALREIASTGPIIV